jgi:hypothetical protein
MQQPAVIGSQWAAHEKATSGRRGQAGDSASESSRVVFSPLLDTRLIEAVRDLRERGFSVLVVDVLNTSRGTTGA